MIRPNILDISIPFDVDDSTEITNTLVDAVDVSNVSYTPWVTVHSATVPERENTRRWTFDKDAVCSLEASMQASFGIALAGNEPKEGLMYTVTMQAVIAGSANGLQLVPFFGRAANGTLEVGYAAPENELNAWTLLPAHHFSYVATNNMIHMMVRENVLVKTDPLDSIAAHPVLAGIMLYNSVGAAITLSGQMSMHMTSWVRDNELYRPNR